MKVLAHTSFAAMVATSAWLAACSASPVLEGQTSTLRGDADASTASFAVAVMNAASTKDPEAYKVVATSAKEIDPASVKFCFDVVANCGAGSTAQSLPGVAQDVDGKKVFLTDKFVRLAANLNITVVAKDMSGADVVQGVKIVAKGSVTPPPGSTAPTGPAGPTGTGGPTGAGGATGTTPPPGTANNPPPAAGAGDCHKAPDEFTCNVEKEIRRLTNEKRATEGKGELGFDKKMGFVSRLWSVEQASRGSISHDWFSDGTWGQKYTAEFNEPSPSFAENVAMTGGGGSDATALASEFVEMWWASPGHHANMVGDYGKIGVGIAKDGGGSWYGTQNFGN